MPFDKTKKIVKGSSQLSSTGYKQQRSFGTTKVFFPKTLDI